LTKIVDNTYMAKIVGILEESILLNKVNIGDDVISFNGRPFVDILDYIYADSLDNYEIEIKDGCGTKKTVTAAKINDYSTLGLEFDESVEITPRECHNNCIFCFVRQLPKGLRDTLYIRDDDYRLSFISGSYITCTNLAENDIQRIIDYKLSPLYVSVHATDEEVHNKLLGIKKIINQMAIIKRLVDNGIVLHTQIVLLGGINDGEILRKSLKELYEVGAKSVAIVPVGLTTFRENLPKLELLTVNQAKAAIKIVEEFYIKHPGFCYCSDEMYQIAKTDMHNSEYYGEYEQIENGVGLVAKFIDELEQALSTSTKRCHKCVGVFTGVSGVSTMEKAKQMIESKYRKVKINIYPVKNTFFGESVTVTGLVTATDIIKCYKDKKFDEKYLMLPSVMLKEFETVFLDNTSVEELSKALNKKIIVSAPTGDAFLEKILNGDR
jgi:putative radical SAM enzyme (TIGR03279 family)